MSQTYKLTLTIRRYDPDGDKSWDQTYAIGAGAILRFGDLFRRINVEQDATLTWVSSCEHGQCGSCSVQVNGRPMLACELLVENAVTLFGTTRFRIEPVTVAPVVRDLVVDWEQAYERVHRAKLYVIRPIEPPRCDGSPDFPEGDRPVRGRHPLHQLYLLRHGLHQHPPAFHWSQRGYGKRGSTHGYPGGGEGRAPGPALQ